MSDHIDNLRLERFTVDDLSATERAEVEQHLSACARCSERVQQTQAWYRADLFLHPPARFVAEVEARLAPRKRRRWLAGRLWIPSLATAALLVVAITTNLPGDDDVRYKGAPLSVHRYRADASTLLMSGDRVRVGDRVEVRSGKSGEIVFVTDTGERTVLSAEGQQAWFVMEPPCTPGWLIVQQPEGESGRLRLECDL